jgi:hypothetical protein
MRLSSKITRNGLEGAGVLGGIRLDRLNRLLKTIGYRVWFDFSQRFTEVKLTRGLDTRSIPLRLVNRLLRPFNVTFTIFEPDDGQESPVVYLQRGKYPLPPLERL